jgi:hypothetical protein
MKRVIVEDCEIVKATDRSRCAGLGFQFATLPARGGGQRSCLLCPCCGYRVFKLYRPIHSPTFACRACHNLSYTSVQKDDARLDRLLKIPNREIMSLIAQNTNMTWKLLAIRAGYIRLGLISKY